MNTVRHILMAGCLALLCTVTQAQPPATAVALNIAEQPMQDALNTLAQQTGLQVVFAVPTVEGKTAPKIEGQYTPQAALNILLSGTRLSYEFVNDKTIAIRPERQSGANTPLSGDWKEGEGAAIRTVLTASDLSEGVRKLAAAEPAASSAGEASHASTSLTVTGTVIDARTGSNLKGALVKIVETEQTTRTDDLGSFRFPSVSVGSYTLHISYLGYKDITVSINLAAGEGFKQRFAMRGGVTDEIVVYGSRSARAQSLNQQRTALNNTTVLSSDLIGDFPGATLAEALRRVPGISFREDLDTREGAQIIIRGLGPELNTIELNGINLPGNSGSRIATIGNILADSIEKVTISKSLLPSQESLGTGGLVEIETKSPLDRPRRFARFSIEGGKKGDDFGEDYLVSGIVSSAFGRENKLGLSASVQYRERDSKNSGFGGSLQIGQYLPVGVNSIFDVDPRTPFPFEPGVSDAYFSSLGYGDSLTDISNLGITLSGEWQIQAHTNLRFDYQKSKQENAVFTRGAGVSASVGYVNQPVVALGGEQRLALTWFGDLFVNQTYLLFNQESKTDTYSFRGKTELGKWTFDYTLGYTDGSGGEPSRTQFGIFSTFTGGPEFILDEVIDPVEGRILSPLGQRLGEGPVFPLLTDAGWNNYNNPENYSFSFGNPGLSTTGRRNDRYEIELNTKYGFDHQHLKYIRVGVDYDVADFATPADPGSSVFGAATLMDLGLSLSDANFFSINSPQRNFLLLSEGDVRDFADSMLGFTMGDNPLLTLFESDFDPRTRLSSKEEKSFSAYLEAHIAIGKLEIIGGPRFTKVDVESIDLIQPLSIWDENSQQIPGVVERLSRLEALSGSSTDVLPRLVFNYRHNENLILRGGYFRSVARPSIHQLRSGLRFNLIFDERFGPNRDQPLFSFSLGNPDLQPAITDNFDLSVEYYDDRIGIMKLGLFYKEIENLIESITNERISSLDTVPLPDDPIFDDLKVNPERWFIRGNQPLNNPFLASVWGIETEVERQFDFLPGIWGGLGIFANYTYSNSDKTEFVRFNSEQIEFPDERFRAVPKYSGTAALTYNKYNIDANLTYTFQSRDRNQFFGRGLSAYNEAEDALSLRAEYRFDKGPANIRVFFEGVDLLKDTNDVSFQSSIGGEGITPKYITNETFLGGRAFRLGVITSF